MFTDRASAGRLLANALEKYLGKDAVVYALPRGGVAVGVEVARELQLPLDLVIARKIGHPHNPEHAVCAVTEDGTLVCDEGERAQLDEKWLTGEVERERAEAKRRREIYLFGRAHVRAEGRIAILVDDGVATGLTIRAALASLRAEQPAKLVVAVPCAPPEAIAELRREADEVIALLGEEDTYLGAVDAYYQHFPQLTDDDVMTLLSRAASRQHQV